MGLPTSVAYDMPTDGPANRVSWEVDPNRAVLLIHDVQEYFIRAFDRHSSPITDVISNITRLRRAAYSAGVPVVYTAQPGNQSPEQRALLMDFWGAGITGDSTDTAVVAALAPGPHDLTLTKWRYSAFVKTELGERMSRWGRDQLIVTGVYAHIGCLATAMDAFMRDIQPFLAYDGVADFSRADHTAAMTYAATRCGAVHATERIVGMIDRDASLSGQSETAA
ncbi:isochorismatase family protein [Rhodococcus sp. NPDC058514]|uniref:isochorismatase family protein n=1 Tax=unclassified Rhodococcus (in: high G+C Gram-positive bacteria) TaxID=192944 RepID=UPI003669E254